jgi:hypothetical protein
VSKEQNPYPEGSVARFGWELDQLQALVVKGFIRDFHIPWLLDRLTELIPRAQGKEPESNGLRTVHGCSACGQDHPIYFVRLASPDGEWTHKGVCPNTGGDVVMRTALDQGKEATP